MQFFYMLAVAIVSRYLAAALGPKPKAPEPQKANIPVAEEGRPVPWIFGDVWFDDSQVLAWRQAGQIPIKGKGKK